MSKKVIIGLSGGVDSAVSCFLLKQQGYDVEAIFMQNWDSYANNEHNLVQVTDKCEYQNDYEDAIRIANHIGIKLHKIDFISEYWDKVFKTFIEEYKKGWTPNPDVLCNKYVKFGAFLDYTLKNFDVDYIAMGHYANVLHDNNVHLLKKAKDQNKDQTYFLCELNQRQLSKTLFPIGNFTKDEVREIAKNNKLPVWDKKDSVGICFIGKREFVPFLKNYIHTKSGNIVDITSKLIIGRHIGISFYTIGQNNNLGLGGMKCKYYVCDKDVDRNIIYVVDEKHKIKYLKSTKCICKNFNWITKSNNFHNLKVRFRHRQRLIDCSVNITDEGTVIYYPDGSLSVTIGQFAVLYDGDICLGGGQVTKVYKDY